MDISYTHVVSKRSRHIRLSIKPDGSLRVSTPPRIKESEIISFIESQKEWIQIHQAKIEQLKQNESEILLFGKTYQKILQYSSTHKTGFRIEKKSLIYNPISPPNNVDQNNPFSQYSKQLERFLKTTAASYIPTRVTQIAATMNTTFSALTLRQQKTRWGSCSSSGNLNFNWRLVHYPPAIIDYVIVHELAHRTHMNHGQSFWALVARYDPDYKMHIRYLKKHGLSVG